MTVVEARFREASVEESMYAHGNLFYQCCSQSFSVIPKIWNRVQSWRSPYPYVMQEPSIIDKTWEGVKNFVGCSIPFIAKNLTFQGNVHHIKDPVVLREFFEHHRSDPTSIFIPGKQTEFINSLLRDCFPHTNTSLFYCTKEQTVHFHALLQPLFAKESIDIYKEKMRETSTLLLFANYFAQVRHVNATQMCYEYFIEVFARNILKVENTYIDKEIQHFQYFLHEKTLPKDFISLFAVPLETFKASLKTHSEAFFSQINPEIINDLKLNDEDDDAKKEFFFTILLSGGDHFTTLLTAAVWHLAKDQNLQKDLRDFINDYFSVNKPNSYPEELELFFARIFKKHPPITCVERTAAKDICLEYKLKDTDEWKKTFFFKGDLICGRIDEVAKKTLLQEGEAKNTYSKFMGFGAGAHPCPGQAFAEACIKEFIIQLLTAYEFSLISPNAFNSKIHSISNIEIGLEKPVYISLVPIEGYSQLNLK